MQKFLSSLILLFLLATGWLSAQHITLGAKVTWDATSLLVDGQRVIPVMGEIHYSRLPHDEWRNSVRAMKAGGVTLIATYVFWNHIEEEAGIFRWDGERSLRDFLQVCKEEKMPVVLRMGPFCHGEVRGGGIPDWVVESGVKLRSEDPQFLAYATRWYRQIFTQVQGLQWKDGGPVLAAQFDNEYRGRASYLLRLKSIANEIGFDLPFYTRTGWPQLATPMPYGEMLPLYGDYADGFWDRSLEEGAGNYYKAFQFKAFRSSTAIATEQLGQQEAKTEKSEADYPYFTCELGGGMATAYHRRPYVYPEDAYAMALVKLGSGSNLLGYYMYHGGTNPVGRRSYLQECQATPVTNYNDMPVLTYDFQAPLGEFGQPYPHYYLLRKLHLFMHDYGAVLAPMEAHFPVANELSRGDDSVLRQAYRLSPDGHSAFVFFSNYARFESLSAKRGVQFEAAGVTFPSRALDIPQGAAGIFPVGLEGMRYATAQIVAKRDGKVYLTPVAGIPVEIALTSGKVLKNVKPRGTKKAVAGNLYLLTNDEAEHLFLPTSAPVDLTALAAPTFQKTREAGANPRTITKGARGVAEAPIDSAFAEAAVYDITLPEWPQDSILLSQLLLQIRYQGDVARLYANGQLLDDNFYYGRPFCYALRRLPRGIRHLQLRILPQQANMPVYFPREAIQAVGESVEDISFVKAW